jgi:hypothetical protein
VPPHCAFDVHVTQTPIAVSQRGVVPPQEAELVAEHWPQAPLGWQAGAAAPQSESPAHARQEWKAGSHTGVAPPQSAFARHGTHVPVVA